MAAEIPIAYTRWHGVGTLVPEFSNRGRALNSNDAMQGRQEPGSLAAEMQRRRQIALETYTPTVEPLKTLSMPSSEPTFTQDVVDFTPLATDVEHVLLAPTTHSHDAA